MKKKLAAILAICMLSVTMTACKGGNAPDEPVTAEATAAEETTNAEPTPAEETTNAEPAPAEETTNAEPDANATTGDSSGFTLLDVTPDLITVGIHAVNENNVELVFSMFTAPSGTPMASMFIYNPDGTGDVICGPYTAASKTDENGVNWSLLTVSDVYREQEFEIGFAETDDGQVYIMNTAGTVYAGEYLTADGTVAYMVSAAALIS